jgi:hypothetical protein
MPTRRWDAGSGAICARAHKRATSIELTGPELLREQGFEVLRSAEKRTGYGEDPSREQYLAGLDHFFGPGSRLVLAGIVDGGLGATHGDGGARHSLYRQRLDCHGGAASAIGTGLVFEIVQACRRGGRIREVAFGLDSAEDRSLVAFKERLGFPVRLVPARVRINPLLARIVRRRHPYQYYRLTGAAPTTTDG